MEELKELSIEEMTLLRGGWAEKEKEEEEEEREREKEREEKERREKKECFK